ncbi:tachylectin-2-like [Pleurodeles waltl]
MPRKETVLFSIDGGNNCRIGLPPSALDDAYNRRSLSLGNLPNASHVFFNPKGDMFVVRGGDLYKGPTPSSPWKDWFASAKRIGRADWNKYKLLYFSNSGKLFAVTKEGEWYRGPEPINEEVPWLYKQASKIGGSDWQHFDALFFDFENIMHGVIQGNLVKGHPFSTTDGAWYAKSKQIGEHIWGTLAYFINFSHDGKLWCVSSQDGAIYTASPPTHRGDNWLARARKVGSGYTMYKCLAFTHDKTIKKIKSFDFLVDIGKVLSMEPYFVAEKVYDNKDSSTPLHSTFELNKVEISESQFSHEHGFDFSAEAETSFESGLPLVAKGSIRLAATTTTSHKWNFTEINRTETHFIITSEFEVEPGKAVRQIAKATKAIIDVPYTATVVTLFGYETTISGTWQGASFLDLRIKQEDV